MGLLRIAIVFQPVSHVQLLATHGWQHTRLPYLSQSPSLLKLMSTESVMLSNHLILCCPFSFSQSFPASGSFPMKIITYSYLYSELPIVKKKKVEFLIKCIFRNKPEIHLWFGLLLWPWKHTQPHKILVSLSEKWWWKYLPLRVHTRIMTI